MSKAFIIAEIGVNHDNDMSKAKLLILEGVNAGADAVKFQTFSGETLATAATPKAPYQLLRDRSKDHKTMLSQLELSRENHVMLLKFCESVGIEFISTAYTLDDAKFLVELGLNKIKVASADIVDTQMLDYLSKVNVTTILSTGMASWTEIVRGIGIFDKSKQKPWILHCVSEYPTPLENANLMRIEILKDYYEGVIGYSDHTTGLDSATIAFGLGARVFEKHYTYDKKANGPDHAASADILDFKNYVTAIRNSELALGSNLFERSAAENSMAKTSRKSLHFKHDMKAGAIIEEIDIKLIRPGDGYFWDQRNLFMGKKLLMDVFENDKLIVQQIGEKNV